MEEKNAVNSIPNHFAEEKNSSEPLSERKNFSIHIPNNSNYIINALLILILQEVIVYQGKTHNWQFRGGQDVFESRPPRKTLGNHRLCVSKNITSQTIRSTYTLVFLFLFLIYFSFF